METMTEVDPPHPARRLRARRCRPGRRPLEVAASIGPRLAKDAVGAELDGREGRPAPAAHARTAPSASSPSRAREAGEFIRHSAEHVLADAVKRLWPEAEIDVGRKDHTREVPVRLPLPPRLHARGPGEDRGEDARDPRRGRAPSSASRSPARRPSGSSARWARPSRSSASQDIPEGETITLYRHGRFTDLCRGPHAQRLSQIGAVKLLEASGVYWRGDEKNERLQRIYGTAFASAEGARRVPGAASRRRGRATTAGSARSSTSSASTRWRRRCPFFHPKGAVVYNAPDRLRARALRAATATARWSRRRSSTSSCGRPRGTTTTTARTCSSPRSTSGSSRSSR